MFQKWNPSNKPTRYDEARVARLEPIEIELEKLELPLVRLRKLNGILNALEVQIENGGDHPQVNNLLLEALREGVKHQVGEARARATLRAIDDFHFDEMERWKWIKAGDLPPAELSQEMQLDNLMQSGYELLQARREAKACDRWLKAWELIKEMVTPEMRTVAAFDDAYPSMLQSAFNWCSDLERELHNAGLDDPTYHEHRLRYAREFLAQFPDVGVNRHVNFLRAQGDALWNLGRRAKSEEVYEELVKQFPDEAWGYIGWSDHYWLRGAPDPADKRHPKEYGKAEAILKRALARPNLHDRNDVMERLTRLREEWNSSDGPTAPSGAPPPAERPGRNEPCWCGSGKKYKHCHLRSD